MIAFNDLNGIDASGSGNAIRTNAIFDIGGLGIDQSGGGVTGNDFPDDDGVQNFPVPTDAVVSGGSTNLAGSFMAAPSSQFEIRFYVSPSCDGIGFGEGRAEFATGIFNSNTDGVATIDTSYNIALMVGHVVTATAPTPRPTTHRSSRSA